MQIYLRHNKCYIGENIDIPLLLRIGDTIIHTFAWERCSKEYTVTKVCYNSKGENIEVAVKDYS